MRSNPNVKVLAGRAGRQAQHAGAALLYRPGARRAAKRQRQKLIDFLLSKEAQSSVSAISYGMPVRKDVTPTDDNFRQSQAALKGVDIWAPDWNQVVSSLSADISRWQGDRMTLTMPFTSSRAEARITAGTSPGRRAFSSTASACRIAAPRC